MHKINKSWKADYLTQTMLFKKLYGTAVLKNKGKT